MAILLIGTLDTKGVEFEYVRDCLRRGGTKVPGPRRRRPRQAHLPSRRRRREGLRRRRHKPGSRSAGPRSRPGHRRRPCAGWSDLVRDCHDTRRGVRRPRPGRLGRHHHRHRRHAGPALWRAEAHGQHPGQRPGPALRRRPRHPHDALASSISAASTASAGVCWPTPPMP